MSYNEMYYQKVLDGEAEMEKLDEAIEEARELQRENAHAKSGYDLEKESRKALEKLYERRLYLQYVAARTFHPFSEFGKLCLEKAQEITDEYESEIGLLTTGITKENVERFKGSLTNDLIDDICSGKYRAIGALRYDGDGVYGVGALVYTMETDRLGDEKILRIKWLFVKESFRDRGVATMLLGGLLLKSASLGIENILCEVPIKREWNQAYYKLLSDWHFDFEAGLAPQLYLQMSDVEMLDELLDLAADVKPWKKLPAEKRKALSGKFSENYFDGECSCFLSKGDAVLGALLVHRLPSGTIRMERMEGDQKYGENLFSYMIISAKELWGDDAMVELFAESEEMNDYFDTYYAKHLRTSVILASLQKPYGNTDTSVEEAIRILSERERGE